MRHSPVSLFILNFKLKRKTLLDKEHCDETIIQHLKEISETIKWPLETDGIVSVLSHPTSNAFVTK